MKAMKSKQLQNSFSEKEEWKLKFTVKYLRETERQSVCVILVQ